MKQREKNAKKRDAPIEPQRAQRVFNPIGRPQDLDANGTIFRFLAASNRNSNLENLASHGNRIAKR